MNSADIELAIGNAVDKRAHLLVSNVSWGLIPWGEADLLQMSGSGYLTEYEIKVSRADLVREWQKRRWTNPVLRREWTHLIKRYYIAVPADIADACEALIPEWAGLVLVADDIGGPVARFIRQGSANNSARALTKPEQFQMARLGAIRYWRAADALGVARRNAAQTREAT